MERRKFLKIAGIGTATVVAIPVIGFSVTSFEGTAVNLILRECSSLKIERQEVEKFVSVFYKNYFRSGSSKTSIMVYKTRLKGYYFAHSKPKDVYMINTLVRSFLLSSTFFIDKMDESKPVKFVQLYNPHKMPCSNPFSNLYYPPASIS